MVAKLDRFVFFLFLFVPSVLYGQSRTLENAPGFAVVEEPLMFHHALPKHSFRAMLVFRGPDSLFNPKTCRLILKQTFNDTGQRVQVWIGKNISRGEIDYVSTFRKITDSSHEATTVFSPQYIQKESWAFHFDTLLYGRKTSRALYLREPDSSVVVKSILFFGEYKDYPAKVFRYDRDGTLREAVYPLGKDNLLRQYRDSLLEDGELTVRDNYFYKENSYHTFVRYDEKRKVLENGNSNVTYGRKPSGYGGYKTRFIYDDDDKLILAVAATNDNHFLYTESYLYQGKTLIEYVKNERASDSLKYEKRVYNLDGTLKASYNVSSVNERKEELSIFHYTKGLKSRRDDYFNGKLTGSSFFHYE